MAYTANITTLLNDISSTPQVVNYLRPNAFRFSIKDLPNTAYTCQSANLPSLQLGFVNQPNPFVDIPRIGDKLTYGDFTIRFIIAEDMRNYRKVDVIFCRNLLIYFDDQSRRQAAETFFDALNPGGFVCLGHSESMSRISSLFRVRKFPEAIVYQKPGEYL